MEINKNLCQPPEYTPDIIKDIYKQEIARALRINTILDILGDDYDLDHLRKLVEADRDERCAVLPCKPGDAVWIISERGSRCVERWIVHRVYKRDVGGWYFDLKNMMLSQKRPNEFEMCKKAISSFGKTVFPTREAAEDALKGEQNAK